MEEIKWHKQSEEDIYNEPIDWEPSYYDVRMKDGTYHLIWTWLDEDGEGTKWEHYEFYGEDEPIDLDEIELWRPANSNTDGLNKAAQEYSFMIPTQCEADSLWKQETEQHFKDGAIWGKEQAIKKACECLWNIFQDDDCGIPMFDEGIKELIEDFKKAMEE